MSKYFIILNGMSEKKNIAADLLKNMVIDLQQAMNGTLDGITDEVAAHMPPGKANPVAGIYAHLAMSEDFFVQLLLQGKPPLMQAKFKDKTGASEIQPTDWEKAYPAWLKNVKVDAAQLKTYYTAVQEETLEYVSSLEDKDLIREVDMTQFGMDKRPVGSVIGGLVIGHAYSLMGEIAALKGIQGLKGYPF
jgi:hypothetical protein